MTESKGEYHTGGRVTSAPQQAVAELSGYYAMIPAELIASKNANAVLLYSVIDRIAGKPDCFASLERLCQDTGLSVNTVRKARDWLISEGFLEVVNQGTGHHATDYHLPFRSQRRGKAGVQILIQTPSIPINSCTPGIPQIDNQGIEPSIRATDKGENPRTPANDSAAATSFAGDAPIWFSVLSTIEGFKTTFIHAQAWREKTGITEDLAERKAYALRDWWPRQPKKRRMGGDPYLTWTHWCREEKDRQHGATERHPQENSDGWEGARAAETAHKQWIAEHGDPTAAKLP